MRVLSEALCLCSPATLYSIKHLITSFVSPSNLIIARFIQKWNTIVSRWLGGEAQCDCNNNDAIAIIIMSDDRLDHHFSEKVRNQIEVCRKSWHGLSGRITIIRLCQFKPMSVRWPETEWSRHLDWDVQCPDPGDKRGWGPYHPFLDIRGIARVPPPGVSRSASQYLGVYTVYSCTGRGWHNVCTVCLETPSREHVTKYINKCKMWLCQ